MMVCAAESTAALRLNTLWYLLYELNIGHFAQQEVADFMVEGPVSSGLVEY